ncbi:MAG: hypothetical protein WC073_10935 [Sterolibacterium sp.]
MRRNWKSVQPTGLLHALRLCKDHARECKSLSVERIAELMAVSVDLLYKWLGNGRMPLNLLPAYEHICGINFASRWLSMSANQLVIPIPNGKAVTANDVSQLQALLNTAVGHILEFAAGKVEADAALAAIHAGMAGLAWHHEAVKKHAEPEFDFGGEEE